VTCEDESGYKKWDEEDDPTRQAVSTTTSDLQSPPEIQDSSHFEPLLFNKVQ
jgi:hypothetical protein